MPTERILPSLTPELYVRDLRRSLDFYLGLLGFELRFERPETHFAAIELDGVCFMLEQVTDLSAADERAFVEERRWNTAALEYPFGRGMNFLISPKDAGSIHERLVAAGYPIKLPREERWYRVDDREVGVRQFAVMDPDGFLLRFDEQIGFRPVRR